MINNIIIGQYYPADSPIHRLDPRTKIACVFLYIITLFLAKDYLSYSLMIGTALLMIGLSRIPLLTVVRTIKPIIIMVILTAVLNIFLTPGREIWHWGILKITREGLDQGIFMTIRLMLLIGVSSLLTLTTTPISLTDGMEKLLTPLKRLGVPAHELAMMMTIALRFVPTLLEETDKIMKAQISRGADFKRGGLIKRGQMILPLLVPLFISAFRRADELALAMEARGYHGGEGRTRMKVLTMKKADWRAILCGALLLLLMGYGRWLR